MPIRPEDRPENILNPRLHEKAFHDTRREETKRPEQPDETMRPVPVLLLDRIGILSREAVTCGDSKDAKQFAEAAAALAQAFAALTRSAQPAMPLPNGMAMHQPSWPPGYGVGGGFPR